MTGERGHHVASGRFRTVQNWIGPPGSTAASASYIPPPPQEEGACLAAWEKFLHESKLPPLVTIGLAHYQFEAIHPFLDGNGRVGRLLVTLLLIERQIGIRSQRSMKIATATSTSCTLPTSQALSDRKPISQEAGAPGSAPMFPLESKFSLFLGNARGFSSALGQGRHCGWAALVADVRCGHDRKGVA